MHLPSPSVTLAADTRAAVRRRPFLHEALRAGVLNYAAAARLLDVDGEDSAVVAALRRYAETLPPYDETARDARVTMRSGLGERSTRSGGQDDDDDDGAANGGKRKDADSEGGGGAENDPGADPLLRVGDRGFAPDAGTLTGVLVTGTVDSVVLFHVLERLAIEGIDPAAAGVAGNALALVVSRGDGPTAVRVVESALDAVPE